MNKKSSKKITSNNRISLPVMLLIAVILLGFIAWINMTSEEPLKNKVLDQRYLVNQNRVVCMNEQTNLACEDLESGASQTFTLPKKYRNATISSSPDGSRLLITTAKNGVVVTDTNFVELAVVMTAKQAKARPAVYAWTHDSNVLISQIGREKNDADFLPEPLVVSLLDVETSESRRIYKTGESKDVENIRVLGADSIYLFIAMPTAKNWVAQSTNPPAETLHAVRLSDGYVRPINSHTLESIEGQELFSHSSIAYDGAGGLFVFSDQILVNNEPVDYHTLAILDDGAHGLTLRKVFQETGVEMTGPEPLFTTRGTLKSSSNLGSFELIDDIGAITPLGLAREKYGVPFSLSQMPLKQ